MNKDFIDRAEKITSFNISTRDLQSLEYKNEIRHLFTKHFFPGFDLAGIDTVCAAKLNAVVSELKSYNTPNFELLHNYNLKGVGPAEVSLYYLLDSAHLCGGSSPGVDIVTDCGHFEVKAAQVSLGIAKGFKLGGTVPLSDIILELGALKNELELPGSDTEISKITINVMRQKAPEKFQEIEFSFANIAGQYFNGHKVIFVNHASKKRLGIVEAIKTVTEKDITIERVTAGTIKPEVKL